MSAHPVLPIVPIGPRPDWVQMLRAFLLSLVFATPSGNANTAAGVRSPVPDAAAAADFQRLILPHLDAAYSLARYLTRDAIASDDIVQEAYLKAFRHFSGFRGGDPRAWILTIVRNTTRDWQASQRMERRYIAPLPIASDDEDLRPDAIETIAAEIESAEAMLERDGEDRRIRAVIELIPDRLREVLVLREMEDLSYREIADITQLPIGTVMSRLARARDVFSKIWRRLETGKGAR
ncbi:sigma-70 family RNA polymerase sigma factor [Pleomorphomonas oryzae]|uniref:sigma-70 family RNA polymerase sigma factor n=1 Tax=Pleomorphomonas oryzae TaxID=261934 RepID=UPI001FDEA7E6|nr:sigma-70 family RNA polymerase sigma factor [Pleomorphomonas oryzae]